MIQLRWIDVPPDYTLGYFVLALNECADGLPAELLVFIGRQAYREAVNTSSQGVRGK
jgi:hypothetical protein